MIQAVDTCVCPLGAASVLAVLDVGGSSIRPGAVWGDRVVVGESVPSLAQGSADTVVGQLATAVDAALACARSLADAPVERVVLAFPGPFDPDAGRALVCGHGKFDSIHGVDLRAALAERLDLSDVAVSFVRDSEAVGVAEAAHGAGRSARRVLTMALRTGLGTCLTVDGVVVERVGGVIVEQLHRRPTPHGRADDVLSARGLAALHRTPHGHAEFGRRLGAFIEEVAEEIEVDLVVMAGGPAGSFHRFEPSLRQSTTVPCVPAELGVRGPLLGAAMLVGAGG